MDSKRTAQIRFEPVVSPAAAEGRSGRPNRRRHVLGLRREPEVRSVACISEDERRAERSEIYQNDRDSEGVAAALALRPRYPRRGENGVREDPGFHNTGEFSCSRA